MAQPATAAAGRCRRATDARPRSRDAVQLAVAGDPGRTLSGPLCRQRGARAGGPVAWRGTGRVRRCRARGVAADRGQSRAPGVHAGRDDPSGRPALSRDPRHALRYRFSRPTLPAGSARPVARCAAAARLAGARGGGVSRTRGGHRTARVAGRLAAAPERGCWPGALPSGSPRTCEGREFMSISAMYPGTFDPITSGRLDLVRRAAAIFDRVVVAIAANPAKAPLFTLDERVELAAAVLADLPNVEVRGYSGLTVKFAQEHGLPVMIRGLRAVSDFEFEFQLATMSRHIAGQVETVFLTPTEQFSFISSSMVREIAMLGGDVSRFVDPVVEAALKRRAASRAGHG